MPKKKGTKGGNPTPPQTPEFLARQFDPAPDVPEGVRLSKSALSVKLSEDVDAMVRSLPTQARSRWLRRVITDAARRELTQEESHAPQD